MCALCGCGSDAAHPHDHHLMDDHHHEHDHHDHPPEDDHGRDGIHHGQHDAVRRIRIERDLLAANDRHAAANRAFLARRNAFALNMLSSPGSGKTTLLERTIVDLRSRLPISVVEGDQETSFDADRVRATGVQAVQINTGRECHLDAHRVGHALAGLDPPTGAVVFIENVGNLVCPAAFDLGEARKVVLLSVTEGDDKPRKYKDMFAVADLVLITKVDLLPYVRFDLARCRSFAHAVNPGVQLIEISAVDGSGLDAWYAWILARRLLLPVNAAAAPCASA